jgi:ATP-binding cassette subfamily D (ALD) protein 3
MKFQRFFNEISDTFFKVAMARLFFHKPAFGILDECTSAVSVDVEAKIYQTCSKLGITIFTVSHRPQLMHHHDFVLKLDGEGGWDWQAIEKDK